jgi:hypothetical protein
VRQGDDGMCGRLYQPSFPDGSFGGGGGLVSPTMIQSARCLVVRAFDSSPRRRHPRASMACLGRFDNKAFPQWVRHATGADGRGLPNIQRNEAPAIPVQIDHDGCRFAVLAPSLSLSLSLFLSVSASRQEHSMIHDQQRATDHQSGKKNDRRTAGRVDNDRFRLIDARVDRRGSSHHQRCLPMVQGLGQSSRRSGQSKVTARTSAKIQSVKGLFQRMPADLFWCVPHKTDACLSWRCPLSNKSSFLLWPAGTIRIRLVISSNHDASLHGECTHRQE